MTAESHLVNQARKIKHPYKSEWGLLVLQLTVDQVFKLVFKKILYFAVESLCHL